MIRRKLGRKTFACLADRNAKPPRGVIYGCHYMGWIDLGRVAELDPRRRHGDGHVHGRAMVVEHKIEIAERRIVVRVLQVSIAAQPLEHGFHFHQEWNQIPVCIAAPAGAAVRLHAGRHAGEGDVAAMAAHRGKPGGLGDDDSRGLHAPHQL